MATMRLVLLFSAFMQFASVALAGSHNVNSRYSTKYVVEHATIPCNRTFDAARTSLETSLPPINTTYSTLIQAGDVAGALAALEALPPLNSFIIPPRDFGSLLQVKNITGKLAVQYEIGNPLTATNMSQYYLPVVLYAPVRVVLSELENDPYPCGFSFDTPTSTFGNLAGRNPDVLAVAQFLESELRTTLVTACGWSRDKEWEG
ncbi:hypothetical protein GQ53DRAFT_748548 [Thozetella sp. PMI_491]|nr:hypothetical protein GQ53DRAFT_748548 [Thozetella sp. PMI_491]